MILLESTVPDSEERDRIKSYFKADIDFCYQCGGCTGVCPWGELTDFNPRKLIRIAQLGLSNLTSEDIWYCTSCSECVDHCPHQILVPEIMSSLRASNIEKGKLPKPAQEALESLYSLGNPWGGSKRKRIEWTKDLNISEYEDQEVLWWVGCTPAYDERSQEVAKVLTKIFDAIDVDFGILGLEEQCCAEMALWLGEVGLFESFVEKNLEIFKNSGAEKIITTSPHCYDVFRNRYPDIGIDFLHYTQYLHEKLGDFRFSNEFNFNVIYQDPCTLARRNEVYEEPRVLLQKVPGLNLLELDKNRGMALCCGGGGGRILMETDPEERFSNIILENALNKGAEVLATTCPFCLLNFEDSVKTLGVEDQIRIMDISEILFKAL